MSTRTETTSSNNNTSSIEPWGPLQSPLINGVNAVAALQGNTTAFQPYWGSGEQAAYGDYVNKLTYARDMNNGGQNYFTPLHTQQQVSPLLENAHYDVQQGAGQLGQYIDNAGQVDAAGRGQQWQDWQNNFLNDSNPYLDQVISDSLGDVRNHINQQFTGAGRSYGSGAYADVMGDRLGKIATQTRYDDYRNRYNQERRAFSNAMNQSDQYGYGAANTLYGQGTNTVLQGSQSIDNQERARIEDIERVNANRATLAKQLLNDNMQLNTALYRTPTLQAASWPLTQMMAPGAAFRSTSGTTSQITSQPNTGFWPGVASTALGLFGGFF